MPGPRVRSAKQGRVTRFVASPRSSLLGAADSRTTRLISSERSYASKNRSPRARSKGTDPFFATEKDGSRDEALVCSGGGHIAR